MGDYRFQIGALLVVVLVLTWIINKVFNDPPTRHFLIVMSIFIGALLALAQYAATLPQ